MTTPINKLSENLVETASGCWEFIGARTGSNYGSIQDEDGHWVGAHVLSYKLSKGPVPIGMFVCHSCDNPPCCNPDHLFLGSPLANKADEIAKGRHVFGEKVGNHKLSEGQVRQIRQMIVEGTRDATIGRQFNITRTMVGHIKNGKAWSWLQ